ncbi:PREDICTED: mucin-20 [Propithecus coquereli]|uniref:mucin-20 n=1 Tax=Propithecus coquereli TaxID=379532 RepID=UPI00063F53AC|nr:PREDICTED: mucin-20 [Propithecus coquereli]
MGSLWGLALPLFFCWEAGLSGSSTGPSTSRPDTLVTTNDIEVPPVTPGTSAPGHVALETQTMSIETFSNLLIPASTILEEETRETETVSPATETRTLTKIIPPKFMVVITACMETSASSGSPTGTGMTTVETVTGSDPVDTIFHTLCTDDSSEEAKRVTTDVLTSAHSSREAEGLSSESSSSSDSSVPVITTSRALDPGVTIPVEGLVACTVTHFEVTNCSVAETETASTASPGASDTDHSPTGVKASSTSDTSALPDPSDVKSYVTKSTTSAETLPTSGATESAAPDATIETPPPTSSTTETETTAGKGTTFSGTSVTVSMDPSGETSAFSEETPSYIEVSGAVTVTEAGSTVDKVTSSAGSSAAVYSPSEVATIKKSTPAETSATDSTTNGPFPTSRSPLPSVPPTTGNGSQGTNITLANTTTSAKTATKPPTTTTTTAQTRQNTTAPASGDGGFLLLRLSVVSPEDLTDPRVAERFVQQLHRELHTHLPPIQVSLLRSKRA